jgi:hypothetical protein
LFVSAPAAFADATNSTNWAGYAVHRHGVSFRSIQATWTQPSATCAPGVRTYSSYWVGLGGYNKISQALEQIGTEVDCKASGQMRSTAWYELVPAPSTHLRLIVHPGDVMRGQVTVHGQRVVLSLFDETRGRGFRKAVSVSSLDVSSAEWIVEAPSECIGSLNCQALPLANFGSAAFGSALVRTSTGRLGSISDSGWNATEIKLVSDGRHFVSVNSPTASIGIATPSPLSSGGSAFVVTYSQLSLPSTQLLARLARSAPTTFTGSIPPR